MKTRSITLMIIFILLAPAACNLQTGNDEGLEEPAVSAGSSVQDGGASDPRSPQPVNPEPPALAPGDGRVVIVYNGTILTMNEAQPTAEALVIQGNMIAAVGNQDELLAYQTEETVMVDLQGRTVMPGFIDPHSHMLTHYEDHGGSILAVQEQALAQGITTMADMGGDTTGELVTGLRGMEANGNLRMRVSLYLVRINNCGEDMGAWYGDFPQSLDPAALVQIPGIKIFTDGGSCNVPAMTVEYPGGGTGDLYFTQEGLNALLAEVDAAGYQAAIHALGDAAIEQTLNAIEEVIGGGENEMRHRIEHNTTVRPDMIPRYSEVNPVALIFGHFPACLWSGDTSQFKYILGEEYRDWDWPYRRLIEANPEVVFAWHGDVPVFPLGTVETLWGFVTRKEIGPEGQVCDPPEWALQDRLPVETALEAMTINAAYALLRENEIGSLEVGKLADLIILSENPLTMPPDDLINLEVLATLVNGNTEYCVGGMETLCP
jgi:predicted amidohydrolase YtcJ